MKTSIKSLALALSFSIVAASTSFGEIKPGNHPTTVSYQESIYTTKDGKLAIALNKEVGGKVNIQLKNKDGFVLYSHQVSKNESQSRLRLDLSELPDGVYQVEITNGTEAKTHTVTISTPQPQVTSRVVSMK